MVLRCFLFSELAKPNLCNWYRGKPIVQDMGVSDYSNIQSSVGLSDTKRVDGKTLRDIYRFLLSQEHLEGEVLI